MINALTWKEGIDLLRENNDPPEIKINWRTRLLRRDPSDLESDIAIHDRYGDADVVIHHKDGTTTISIPNYRTFDKQLHSIIQRYSQITVYTKKGICYITEKDPDLTPAKIQSCRYCKGFGKLDSICFTSNCYNLNEEYNSNRELVNVTCQAHNYDGLAEGRDMSKYRNRYDGHAIRCEHNFDVTHKIRRNIICTSCKGTKTKDYGSKPISHVWSGTPIKVRDGKIVKTPRSASVIEQGVADIVEHYSSV